MDANEPVTVTRSTIATKRKSPRRPSGPGHLGANWMEGTKPVCRITECSAKAQLTGCWGAASR